MTAEAQTEIQRSFHYRKSHICSTAAILKIQFIIKKFPQEKFSVLDRLHWRVQTLSDLTPILHNLFQKTEEKQTCPSLFYEASFT